MPKYDGASASKNGYINKSKDDQDYSKADKIIGFNTGIDDAIEIPNLTRRDIPTTNGTWKGNQDWGINGKYVGPYSKKKNGRTI